MWLMCILWGQSEHKMDFTFAYVWFCLQETLSHHRKLHPAAPSGTEIHKIHNYTHLNHPPAPPFTVWDRGHTHPHLVSPSLWFRVTLLPPLQYLTNCNSLPTPTSTGKLLVFFKVKCHIYYSMYIFPSHLMCAKLCFCLYQVPVFVCVWPAKVLSAVHLTSFPPPKSYGFYCAILYRMAIFRNTCATL